MALERELFAHRWVHVFEEDTERAAVYRPADADIPLSRRPRAWLELSRDGSARILLPGPDDRLREQAATWREEDGDVVIRPTGAGDAAREYRVIERSSDRLLVRRSPA